MFLFPSRRRRGGFRPTRFPKLPSAVLCKISIGKDVRGRVTRSVGLSGSRALPVFVVTSAFGEMIFISRKCAVKLKRRLVGMIRNL